MSADAEDMERDAEDFEAAVATTGEDNRFPEAEPMEEDSSETADAREEVRAESAADAEAEHVAEEEASDEDNLDGKIFAGIERRCEGE